MKKITVVTGLSLIAVMIFSSTPDADAQINKEQRGDRRELRQEQRSEHREMRSGQREQRVELRQEFKSATPQEREVLRGERRELRGENREERKDLRAENKGERNELRKEGRMGATDKRAERFALRAERMNTKLTNITARLGESGVDTATIISAITVLNGKANSVASAYLAYEQAQGGDDKDAIATVRKVLMAARDDFRTYYRETVRPLIKTEVDTIHSEDDES